MHLLHFIVEALWSKSSWYNDIFDYLPLKHMMHFILQFNSALRLTGKLSRVYPLLSPNDTWDRLQTLMTQVLITNGWMDGLFCMILQKCYRKPVEQVIFSVLFYGLGAWPLGAQNWYSPVRDHRLSLFSIHDP